jgi:hypothetical protein
VLDYCRLNDITIQPWSPFQYGFFEGVFLGSDKFPELNKAIDEVAARYDVSSTTMAIAWLLRHPAKMQPVTGTMNLDRLTQCAAAGDITITREEWYQIYLAAGNSRRRERRRTSGFRESRCPARGGLAVRVACHQCPRQRRRNRPASDQVGRFIVAEQGPVRHDQIRLQTGASAAAPRVG